MQHINMASSPLLKGRPLLTHAVSLLLHKKLAGAHLPVPCGLDDDAITQATVSLHPGASPQKGWVSDIIRARGGSFTQGNADYRDAPLLVADGQNSFVVFMPPEPALSARGHDWFAGLALGHMMLHWPPPAGWGAYSDIMYVPAVCREGETAIARQQASHFAIELLMPAEVFFNNHQRGSYENTARALNVDVHPDVVKFRAGIMGYS